MLAETLAVYRPEARAMWQERIDAASGPDGMEPLVEPTLTRWFTAPFKVSRPKVMEEVRGDDRRHAAPRLHRLLPGPDGARSDRAPARDPPADAGGGRPAGPDHAGRGRRGDRGRDPGRAPRRDRGRGAHLQSRAAGDVQRGAAVVPGRGSFFFFFFFFVADPVVPPLPVVLGLDPRTPARSARSRCSGQARARQKTLAAYRSGPHAAGTATSGRGRGRPCADRRAGPQPRRRARSGRCRGCSPAH